MSRSPSTQSLSQHTGSIRRLLTRLHSIQLSSVSPWTTPSSQLRVQQFIHKCVPMTSITENPPARASWMDVLPYPPPSPPPPLPDTHYWQWQWAKEESSTVTWSCIGPVSQSGIPSIHRRVFRHSAHATWSTMRVGQSCRGIPMSSASIRRWLSPRRGPFEFNKKYTEERTGRGRRSSQCLHKKEDNQQWKKKKTLVTANLTWQNVGYTRTKGSMGWGRVVHLWKCGVW